MGVGISEFTLVLTCQKHVEFVDILIGEVRRRPVAEVMHNEFGVLVRTIVFAKYITWVLHRYEVDTFNFKPRLKNLVDILIRRKYFSIYFVVEDLKVQRRKVDNEIRQINSLLQPKLGAILDDVMERSYNHCGLREIKEPIKRFLLGVQVI